jgi:hypothetical protein
MSTTVDSQRSGRSGIMPVPITSAVTTTDQSTQTGSSNTPVIQSTNFMYVPLSQMTPEGGLTLPPLFRYIYSFLSTLFLLLCLAILVLLRALIRRRRLDRHFNSEAESSDSTAQAAQRRRRQKKRPPIGSKPYMSDAWIGNGPVPTSLSTEALLETIQVCSTHPFYHVILLLFQLIPDLFSSPSLSPARQKEPPLRIGKRSQSRPPCPPR